jgi:hypothetical protein
MCKQMTTQYIKNATAEDYQYNQDMNTLLPAHALAPSMKHAAADFWQPYLPDAGPSRYFLPGRVSLAPTTTNSEA